MSIGTDLVGETFYRLLSVQPAGKHESVMEVRRTRVPCLLFRLFGARTKVDIHRFMGSGTVWLRLPSFSNPGLSIQDVLYRLEVGHRLSANRKES